MAQPVRILILIVITLLLCEHRVTAGRVRYAEIGCPACDRKHLVSDGHACFITRTGPGSLLRQMPRGTTRIRTCPYCLYSAFEREFHHLSAPERLAVRATLDRLPETLARHAPDFAGVDLDEVMLPTDELDLMTSPWRDQPLLRTLIAEQCLSAVGGSDFTRNLLRRYAHHTSSTRPEIEPALRRMVMDDTRRRLADEPRVGTEIVLSYLLAELERRDGQPDAARERFEDVRGMIRVVHDRNDCADYGRYDQWCEQQIFLLRTPSLSVEELAPFLDLESRRCPVVLRELGRRSDPRAWSAVIDYINGSEENARHVAGALRLTSPPASPPAFTIAAPLRDACAPDAGENIAEPFTALLPARREQLRDSISYLASIAADGERRVAFLRHALPDWLSSPMVERHTVEAPISARALASKHGLNAYRFGQMNPELGAEEMVPKGTEVRILRYPDGWQAECPSRSPSVEYYLLSALARLIKEGDTRAAEAFVRWVMLVGNPGSARSCIGALRETPSLWPVVRGFSGSGVAPERDMLWRCVLWACGDDAERRPLLRTLDPDEPWTSLQWLVLRELGERRDPAAVTATIEYMTNGHALDQQLVIVPYLHRVMVATDLPALEQALAGMSTRDSFRQRLEQAMLAVRLRDLVERSTPVE